VYNTITCTEFSKGQHVRVKGYAGVAFTVRGPQIERYWDLDEDIYPDDPTERQTGKMLVCMVGDDQDIAIDPDDASPLADDAFCGSCGQIGCSHG
jgi:hypothetical protein